MGQEYPAQPIPAVAGVVIRGHADGQKAVLLVRRANPPSKGEWSLPGGVLELGETLEAGVTREVLEETGIRVAPVSVLEVLDHIVYDEVLPDDVEGDEGQKRVRFHYVLIDFLCLPDEGTAAGASDALEARWVLQQDLGMFGLTSRTLSVIHKGFASSPRGG